MAGALIGAAFIVYLPTLAESVVGAQTAGNWSQLVYALGLALCLMFAPNGSRRRSRSLQSAVQEDGCHADQRSPLKARDQRRSHPTQE